MTEQEKARYREAAARTAEEQRRIQGRVDRGEKAEGGSGQGGGDEAGIQTYTREQPQPPMPQQHLQKPGIEADMALRPRYRAPDYRGSGKLAGKVALITGGDSGIGRAVAVLFAREGADVAIVYLSEHQDAEETRQAVEEEGRRCILIPGDVRDSTFCLAAVEHTVAELGGLNVLVNNAAFQEHVEQLDDLTDEHLDMTMRTNIYGYIYMARAALPRMERGDSIVCCGSETGLFGNGSLPDYSATKGAIHAFAMSLASSVAPRGIRVNVVAPGPVWTPLNPADRSAKEIASFGSTTELKRPAQPEEVAPAFVFLASSVCSSYITGAVLPVMGGSTG